MCVCVCVLGTQSCLTLATPWTIAHQAPLSMEFSRQESWSGLPFPSLGDLPDPGIERGSPALQSDSTIWFTREAYIYIHIRVCVCVCVYNFYLFVFDCAWSSLLCQLFSSCGEQGLLYNCNVRAPHCGGFSVELDGMKASVVVACGLTSCSSLALEHRVSSCGTWA